MTEKIQKILAGRGLGSRREIEQWLRDGRISINGKKALLGERITLDAQIRIDGKPVRLDPEKTAKPRVLIYHKPEGEICTRHDPEGRPSVFDRLPLLRNGRWVSIGRLDFNTSGLLLFTNDGALAHRLMHPSSNIEREYAVRVQGQVTPTMLATLKKGVVLEDGSAHFTSISDQGGEGSNHWYHVTVGQGRNRVVRRLFESQGVMVSRLIRIRFGTLLLPRILRRGKWDEMTPNQITQFLNPAEAAKKPQEKRHKKNERSERHENTGKHEKRWQSGNPQHRSSSAPSRREATSTPDARRRPFKRDANKSETLRHRDKNNHASNPKYRSSAPTSRRESTQKPDGRKRPFKPNADAATAFQRREKNNHADRRPPHRSSPSAAGRDKDARPPRPRTAKPRTDRRADAKPRQRQERAFATALSPRNKITKWHKYPDPVSAETRGRPKQATVKKRPATSAATRGRKPVRPTHREIPASKNLPILSRRKKPE